MKNNAWKKTARVASGIAARAGTIAAAAGALSQISRRAARQRRARTIRRAGLMTLGVAALVTAGMLLKRKYA